MPPVPPAPHFPSPYARASQAPVRALRVPMADGAQIACFVYAPEEPAPGADPVLFLHGNGGEHGSFGPQIDACLEAGLVAVGVDCRAQGKSTRGTEHLTYELLAADALACMDALGYGRFHVIGFSDGAIEALLLARDHADRVCSVVSLGANLEPDGVDDSDFPMEEIAGANEAWADWIGGLPDGGDIDASLLTPTADEARNTAELMRLMEEEPHIPARSLAGIGCPVSVMAGAHDLILPRDTFAIANAIPRSRTYIVAGCGHGLPKQAPDVVSRVLLATIARVGGRA